MTPTEALAEALYLSITAPTDEQSQKAVDLAEQLANGLSEHEVAQAKKIASERADGDGFE